METPQYLLITPHLHIAYIQNSPKLFLNGKQHVKEDNLIEFLVFGLMVLSYSEAVLQNQDKMGLFGVLKKTSQGIDPCC